MIISGQTGFIFYMNNTKSWLFKNLQFRNVTSFNEVLEVRGWLGKLIDFKYL